MKRYLEVDLHRARLPNARGRPYLKQRAMRGLKLFAAQLRQGDDRQNSPVLERGDGEGKSRGGGEP
jgi:hypothetical protein